MSQPSSSSSSSSSFYVVDYEKQFLSAVIRTEGAVLADTPHITAADFSETNRVVFNAIQSCLAGGSFNRFILIQKLNGLNIKIGGVIEPEIYVNAIADLNGVSDKAAIEISKQIKQVTIRRELDRTIDQMKLLVKNSKDMKASELVAAVTGAFNAKVNTFSGSADDEPQDLYGSIRPMLDEDNQYDERGVETPFFYFNDFWGWLDPANVYTLCARTKGGKSTWVMSMLDQIMRKDPNFRALILDTELTLKEVGCRLVSSLTGVKEFYIRRKIYKKHKDMRERVEAAYKLIDPFIKRVDHQFIGGMDFDDQMSIARRWVKKNIKAGMRCLVVYDYTKLGSSSDFSSNSPHITLGRKVDGLKCFSKEMDVPVWNMVQANRENEDSKAGGKIANGNAIAGSDMISQFSSNVLLLEKLSPEERAELLQSKETDATHSLKVIYPRQLGPNESGQDCLVKYDSPNKFTKKMETRYCQNYILYSFHNFRVREVGTFKQLYEKAQIQGVNVQPPPADSGGTVL